MSHMNWIYLDHAATTPCDERVVEAMLPYFSRRFGNPNSIHAAGREARRAVDESREKLAAFFGCKPAEIVFTSGGSESDNLALRGIAESYQSKGNHIITTSVEHHAVRHTCQALEKHGFEVTYLPVDEYGLVYPEQVAESMNERTILVSIIMANNEVGTIQPISDIVRAVKDEKPDVLVHTDAVQAVGQVPVSVNELGVDLLSFTAHKFYGPKGIGGLYVRRGVRLMPQITGGGQERNRRSGTESVALIVGLGKAVELLEGSWEQEAARLIPLRDALIIGILDSIPQVRLNGHPTKRLPSNVNVSVYGVEGESVLLQLDMHGICASSGSACTSGSLEPSHVLMAMGLSHEWVLGSLRLSLGRSNTKEHVESVLELLAGIVEKIRSLSPMGLGVVVGRS